MALTLFYILILFVILQRLSELFIARRNERWLRAQGAIEVGRSHYPYIVMMHVTFFVSLLIEVVMFNTTAAAWWWIPFTTFLLAQGLRYWSIASLGRRWNTRILILPNAPPIRTGPYRFLSHPNYVAVAIELLTLPLVFQAYFTAALFTVLNFILMTIRIPAESKALRGI